MQNRDEPAAPGAQLIAAVNRIPALSAKAHLLLAASGDERRAAVRLLPPPQVALLVDNLPDECSILAADLDLDQWTSLLRLCSPSRQLEWLGRAVRLNDTRASLLLLLLPTPQLAEALLTQPAFESHVRAVLTHPIQTEQVNEELLKSPAATLVHLYGREGLLRKFPIQDACAEEIVSLILSVDIDRYVSLLRHSLALLESAEAQTEEQRVLTEDPILLRDLPSPEAVRRQAAEGDRVKPATASPSTALAPVQSTALASLLSGLPEATARAVRQELQELYLRQVVAFGGSFAERDLQRAIRHIEAYLQLGLLIESGNEPEAALSAIQRRPLRKIMESGGLAVEGLRQIAFRLQPLGAVLTDQQKALLETVIRPRPRLDEEGRPMLVVHPAPGLPHALSFLELQAAIESTAAWIELARALGLTAVASACASEGPVVCQRGIAEALTAGRPLPPSVREHAAGSPAREEQSQPGGTEAWAAEHAIDPASLARWAAEAARPQPEQR